MERVVHIVPQISMYELCMDCMKEKAEYLCDMPSDTAFIHRFVNGYRKLEIASTCDRQICRRCAIEITTNI